MRNWGDHDCAAALNSPQASNKPARRTASVYRPVDVGSCAVIWPREMLTPRKITAPGYLGKHLQQCAIAWAQIAHVAVTAVGRDVAQLLLLQCQSPASP